MAVVTEPTKWTEALGASADANEIPSTSTTGASMQSIFPLINALPIPAGGVAPARKDFNGLMKLLGDSIYFLQHGGKFSYDATFDYAVGNIVMYNNVLYMCVTANGASSTVVTPGTDKTYWYPIINSDPWQNFPTGFQMIWTSKNPIPDNWFIENGQSVSKTTYANLNAFLNSDGSRDDPDDATKFIIPDMTGRVWQGCSSYDDVLTPLEAGLPNVIGGWSMVGRTSSTSGAAFFATSSTTREAVETVAQSKNIDPFFNLSLGNAIYSDSVTTVQPPARQALIIIKA